MIKEVMLFFFFQSVYVVLRYYNILFYVYVYGVRFAYRLYHVRLFL
jgi:hypothetical protein